MSQKKNTVIKKASEISVGDYIQLDRGYDMRENMVYCKVLSIHKSSQDLFGNKKDEISFYADDGRERFYTISFASDEQISTIPARPKRDSKPRQKKYTIEEIAAYIYGWSSGPFGKAKTINGATLHNALIMLNDPQDGIEARIKRNKKPK